MKRIVAVASLLALGFVAGRMVPPMVVRAEDAKVLLSPVEKSASDDGSLDALLGDVPDGLFVFPDATNAGLRKQFLDLMARRAAEMSDDELRQQINELTQRMAAREKEADNALNHILGELAEIVKRYPGTAAAAKAARAKATIDGKGELAPMLLK